MTVQTRDDVIVSILEAHIETARELYCAQLEDTYVDQRDLRRSCERRLRTRVDHWASKLGLDRWDWSKTDAEYPTFPRGISDPGNVSPVEYVAWMRAAILTDKKTLVLRVGELSRYRIDSAHLMSSPNAIEAGSGGVWAHTSIRGRVCLTQLVSFASGFQWVDQSDFTFESGASR